MMTNTRKLPKLDLNITNRCNFRCVHCAFDSGIEKMDELSLDELETILRETKELGGEKIDITGGEPTVRKDLAEIIKLGKKYDFKIELVTNGSLITKNELLEYKNLGLDSTAISLDGSNYKVYNKIRKVSEESFNKTLQTIEDSVNIGLPTKINTVVFSSNLEDIPNITELAIKKGAQEHGLYYFTPIGRGNSADELSVEPIKWLNFIREKLVKYNEQIKLLVEVPLIEKDFSKKKLGCIMDDDPYHLQILPDGNVYPCAIMASYHKPIANLHEKSVKEIWNDKSLWDNCFKEVSSDVFNECSGYCTNFSSFNLKKYDTEKYKFVCPLRKFSVTEFK
ncbi:MAG: radical SAM protein [archaeon]